MKKRHFLLGTLAAAGAVSIGWALLPPRQRLQTARPLAVAPGQVAFNGWLKIAQDGSVSVVMPKTEMGQGVHTGLAMVLADELDADWSRVAVEPAPIDAIYNNLASVVDGLPFHPDSRDGAQQLAAWLTGKAMREFGLQMTGGSSSIKDLWLPMRSAGASARALLVAAAAQQWQLPAREISVSAGVVAHRSGRSASFGELVQAASTLPLPDADGLVLKQPVQFTLVGRPLPRLAAEAAAKGRGQGGFALDVQQPGQLYATVVMSPMLGGRVLAFDARAAAARPGVRHVLAFDGAYGGSAGVAVLADSPWHALQALPALQVQWDDGTASAFSSAQAMDALARTLDTEAGLAYFKAGDVDAAFAGAARTLQAEYRAPLLAHATLEPQNCTVLFSGDSATVWAPTQVPDLARRAVARMLDLPPASVDVRVQALGGGFGRRLDIDFIAQAAVLARAVPGTPLQTFWSREQDTRHDFYRPPAVARYSAALDGSGRLLGWRATSAGPAVMPQVVARLFGVPAAALQAGPDKTSAEGAFDQPYEWPAARIAHASVEWPVPVGFWRSVGHSHQAFFKESFVDEVAHASGQDPLAFRLALLQRHPRHAAVLRQAAQMAGWGKPAAAAPDGARVARGLALHQSFGSIVAQVAEVSLASDGAIRVHRVACAIDCGTAINPNLVAQQMEGAIVFGLSAALHGRIDIERGRVLQANFDTLGLMRIDACPAIAVQVLPSTEHPEGVGEPGVPPIAPALANAVFALTGTRLRSLPLTLAPAAAPAAAVNAEKARQP